MTRDFVSEHVIAGRLNLQVSTFAKAGGVLPIHQHGPTNHTHGTGIISGRFVVHGKREGLILEPGDFIPEWPRREPHGFEALTDGAVLVNWRPAEPFIYKRRPRSV